MIPAYATAIAKPIQMTISMTSPRSRDIDTHKCRPTITGMNALQPGQNPRDCLPCHRERGSESIIISNDDLRTLAHTKLGRISVRQPLEVIISSVVRLWERRNRILDPSDTDLFSESELLLWDRRYPRVELYRCIFPGCATIQLSRGLCRIHCGSVQGLSLNEKRYMCIRTGNRQIPLHQVIANPPKGMHVHHIDLNKWNNHPDNLAILTQDEHWEIHHPHMYDLD